MSMFSNSDQELNEKFYPSLNSNLENINKLTKKYNIKKDKKIIIFAPGAAFGPSKMWPVDKFV